MNATNTKPARSIRFLAWSAMAIGLSLHCATASSESAAHVDRPEIPAAAGEARMGDMIDAGDCWTGGDHPVPSRVWTRDATRDGGVTYTLRGAHAASETLDALFGEGSTSLDAVAYCA